MHRRFTKRGTGEEVGFRMSTQRESWFDPTKSRKQGVCVSGGESKVRNGRRPKGGLYGRGRVVRVGPQ